MTTPCPTCGFVKQHIKPHAEGGTDAPSNYIGVYKEASDRIRPIVDTMEDDTMAKLFDTYNRTRNSITKYLTETYWTKRLHVGRLFVFFEWKRK